MSTYSQLQDRVNLDYLNRSDLTSETQRAIQAAIRTYERRRWWFNETATTMATVASQTFATFPANFLKLDTLQVTQNSQEYELHQRDIGWIRRANTARSRGLPTDFAIYQNRAELFSIPDSAYSLPVYYLHKLPALSAASDTNSFTTDLEDLIVYHAAKLMWSTLLRNDTEAARYVTLEQQALSSALKENEQRLTTSLKPTRF